MERQDMDYLAQVYRETRELIDPVRPQEAVAPSNFRKEYKCLSYPTPSIPKTADQADVQIIDKLLMGGSYLPEPGWPLPPQEPERLDLKLLETYRASMCLLSYPAQEPEDREPEDADHWMGEVKVGVYQTAIRWLLVYLAIMTAFNALGCSSLLDLIGLIF